MAGPGQCAQRETSVAFSTLSLEALIGERSSDPLLSLSTEQESGVSWETYRI